MGEVDFVVKVVEVMNVVFGVFVVVVFDEFEIGDKLVCVGRWW